MRTEIINISSEIMKNVTRSDSSGVSGARLFQEVSPAKFWIAFWRQRVDFGRHVGAHWILKGVPNVRFFSKSNIRYKNNKV
jgi:hypothetical protein